MPVSRQHHTKARRDRARIFHAIKTARTVSCPNCKTEIIPHRICPKCGYYKGREIINTMKRANKKTKNKKK